MRTYEACCSHTFFRISQHFLHQYLISINQSIDYQCFKILNEFIRMIKNNYKH